MKNNKHLVCDVVCAFYILGQILEENYIDHFSKQKGL